MRTRRLLSALRPAMAGVVVAFAAACAAPGASDEAGSDQEATEADAPARVTLSDTALEAAGVRLEVVSRASPAPSTGSLSVPGEVTLDSTRVAVVSPRAAGRLESMSAAPGERVLTTDTVALLTSPEYLAAQEDLVQAARRADLLEGTSDAEGALAILDAARRRLLLVGADAAEVDALLDGSEPSLVLALRPPFPSTVLAALTEPGVALVSGQPVYRIADLTEMHVVARVPEEALTRVRSGVEADVKVRAYPTRTFTGRVSRILETLDSETRTVGVVVTVPNADRALKDGMYATVLIRTSLAGVDDADGGAPARIAGALAVPLNAVLSEGAESFVFVEVAPRTFERREVSVLDPVPGGAPSDRVVVTSGLSEGDRVVVSGGLVLRSELARARLVDID